MRLKPTRTSVPIRSVPNVQRLLVYKIAAPLYQRAEDRLEAEQILVRIGMGTLLITGVYCIMPSPQLRLITLWLAAVYALFSACMLAWIFVYPRPSVARRIVGIFGDVGAGAAFSFLDPPDFLYMFASTVTFIAIGNGFRYSAHYLRITVCLGAFVLVSVHFRAPYWNQPPSSWASTLTFLLLLSAYILRFMRERDSSESLLALRTQELEQQTAVIQVGKEELQNALRAREHLLSKVSHELRTPLNNLLQLLRQSNGVHDGFSMAELRGIRVCAELVQDQVGNLLDLADAVRGEKEEASHVFDLVELLQGLAVAAKVDADKKGVMVTFVSESRGDAIVKGPADAIRQIVWNLLTNALKFTHTGTITVRLSGLDDAAVWGASGQMCVITVQDTGIGIAQDNIEKIWEPFYQVDDSVGRSLGGTGLGLAIARERAKRIGGTLSVRSILGVGSSFRLDLTLTSAVREERERLRQPVDEFLVTDPPLRILVAEDDFYSRATVELALEKAGHEVVTCLEGNAALDTLCSGQSFDVAIIDYHLPGLHGPEVAKRYTASLTLSDASYRPLLVMWTAGLTPKSRDEALRSGFDFVFTKTSGWLNHLRPVLQSAARRRLGDQRFAPYSPACDHFDGDDPASRDESSNAGNRRIWNWRAPSELFLRYVKSVEATVYDIDNLLATGKVDTARDVIHRMKGQSALFGSPIDKYILHVYAAAQRKDLRGMIDLWPEAKLNIERYLAKQQHDGGASLEVTEK